MIFQSVNPATEEVVGETPSHSHNDVESRIARAHAAQREWSALSVQQRALVVGGIADHLVKRAEELAPFITMEMGKPLAQSIAEIEKCALVCRYMSEIAPRVLRDVNVATEFASSVVRQEPLGLVLSIMPWNFPFWQFFRFAAPVLIAGNGIVLKHAPNTMMCAAQMAKLCEEAGLPKDLVINVFVDVPDVEQIIADKRIRAVTFTGSTRGGRAVGALAGRYIKRSVLELGGSDAYIILDDADVERAALIGAKARCSNAGQSCISAKRFLVHQDVVEAFTEQLTHHIHAFSVGDPLQGFDVGPIARADLRATLLQQVDAAVSEGARSSRDVRTTKFERGFYVQPAVLSHVKRGSTADTEELFGPVASVITVTSADEAIAIANASPYGLGAAVFTQDAQRASEMSRRLECGSVFVNDSVRSDVRLPFGGVKESGYGRELGEQGLLEFVNLKTVVGV